MPSSVSNVPPQNSATEVPEIHSRNYIYANELRVLENCRKYFTLLSVLRWQKWFSTTWDCLSSPCPWLHLMGTSDGYDETTLPKILKDFAVTVQTCPAAEEGKFTIRTSPD
ncbi:hypothetical protein IW261DRAFT_1428323 [Armillaria novae-zelandiae]|uniref:Uncharacterized protein n=1 Tax=Armillaria novae-zelandiae TaxID=153914 RepID=A0AA39N9N3_9AGAR|nr:hypothetical protein IW261DRAFT_1428323 [Armillaria novae-zelandiae]